MMRAVSRGWFSYNFEVLDRTGTSIGQADLSNWRENATLDVDGRRYEATHKSGKKEFVLSGEDGATILVAQKPSAWKERFSFEHAGNLYELKRESAWRRDFILSRGDIGTVGRLRPEGMYKRAWSVELPEELPVEIRVFVIWLAVVLWKREDSAAAGGAVAAGS